MLHRHQSVYFCVEYWRILRPLESRPQRQRHDIDGGEAESLEAPKSRTVCYLGVLSVPWLVNAIDDNSGSVVFDSLHVFKLQVGKRIRVNPDFIGQRSL